MARSWAVFAIALFAAGPALADDYLVRTAGAATAIAIDRESIRRVSHYRTGWSYELYRERNPLTGQRTQITGVLLLVNCKTLLSRRLKVAHYAEDGAMLRTFGPERAWTEALRGSNTDLILRAMCEGSDDAWARRKAATVFDLYREVWR